MKYASGCAVFLFLSLCVQLLGGTPENGIESVRSDEFDPHRIEFALETGYLFGAINPPRIIKSVRVFPNRRIRWGVIRTDSWLRGYHQFYISAIAEPIFQGIENHYFGFNMGFRYNFRSATLGDSFLIFRAVWVARRDRLATPKCRAVRGRILRSTFCPLPAFLTS
jgi:hypothetical protein